MAAAARDIGVGLDEGEPRGVLVVEPAARPVVRAMAGLAVVAARAAVGIVEAAVRPALRVVAGRAVGAESALVRVVESMARHAIGRRRLVAAARVTQAAVRLGVRTDQRVARSLVVEVRRVPVGRLVAGRAVFAERYGFSGSWHAWQATAR